jgi:hypothetical protein
MFEGFEEFEGFEVFKGSKVQLPAAFKSSIACGVQGFNCLRRSKGSNGF